MNWISLIFWISSLPDWSDALKPEASFVMEYEEARESSQDEAGLLFGGRAGIFPEWGEQWETGFELQLSDPELSGRPERLKLEEGMPAKPIRLGQIYVAHRPHPLFLISLGKFQMPFRSSPLIWDNDIRPEGAYEAIQLSGEKNTKFKVHSAQYALGFGSTQLSENESLRRSWLFIYGAELDRHWSENLQIQTSFQIYQFFQIPSKLAEASLDRGAEYTEENSNFSIRNEDFLPIEWELELSSSPLGIFTSLRTALALNLRGHDKQRGFFTEAQVGRAWRKSNFLGRISFYYNEPMTSLPYFVERDYGYANTRAGRFELHYYFNEHMRVGSSYLLARRIQESSFQSSRQEVRLSLEFRL